MKSLGSLISLAALTVALAAPTFAASKNEGTFTIDSSVQVGSTVLKPGEYKARWEGQDDALKIDILQRGKVVASTQGKLKVMQDKSPYDDVILTGASNGNTIQEIDFSNRKEALLLGE